MGVLKVWDEVTQQYVPIVGSQGPAGPRGPKGDQGIQGIQGPDEVKVAVGPVGPDDPNLEIWVDPDGISAGAASTLDDLADVMAPAGTPAGRVLGTTATGRWGPVDPSAGGYFLPLTGGTLTGDLVLDDRRVVIEADEGNIAGLILRDKVQNLGFRIESQDGVMSIVPVKWDPAGYWTSTDGALYLDQDGNFDLSSAASVPVPTPGEDGHAATKGYVDSRIWRGTQAEYDAIVTKDPNVLYVIL